MRYKTFKRIRVAVIIIITLFLSLIAVEAIFKKTMPTAVSISLLKSKQKANLLIDEALENTLESLNLTAKDFYFEGENSSLFADTIVINRLCSTLSQYININLDRLEDENVPIPMGVITGLDILSNVGPNINFNILPMGETEVNYETEFLDAGINQTNFKIWINVKITILIVNPLVKERVVLVRKINLLDTIIKGDVPGYMWGTD